MKLKDARRMFNLRDVLGVGTTANPVRCPFSDHVHYKNTPSLNIYWKDGVERFMCMGSCGRAGDVIDLIGYLEIPGYDDKNHTHIKMAIARLIDGFTVEYRVRPRPVILTPNKYRDYLPPSLEVVDYARDRGITEETLDRFYIGSHHGAMAMPYFVFGLLRGIKFRSTRNTGLRFWSEKGSHRGIFNHDEVNYYDGAILFLKSEIPTMLAAQHGFTACGLTVGEGQSLNDFRHVFAFSSKVIYVTDNDEDLEVRSNIAKKARQRADEIHAVVKAPPEEYKDWDEWLLADTRGCLETTRRWLA